MLGLPDPWIAAAYLLSIISAAVCVVYGLANWNKGNDESC
ncbi:MAG: symporter small accessory protein [Bacillota bacterium]